MLSYAPIDKAVVILATDVLQNRLHNSLLVRSAPHLNKYLLMLPFLGIVLYETVSEDPPG